MDNYPVRTHCFDLLQDIKNSNPDIEIQKVHYTCDTLRARIRMKNNNQFYLLTIQPNNNEEIKSDYEVKVSHQLN